MTALRSALRRLTAMPRWATGALLASVVAAGSMAILPAIAQNDSTSGRRSGWGWQQRDNWQPGWMNRRMWRNDGRNGDMRARMQRHWTFMHSDIASQYQGARSDVPANAAAITAGGKLYTQHCASCHGKTGMGDGEAGKGLSPSPALLAYMIQRPMAVDEFLLWSISEGGAQFKTAMPAYKDVLKRQEIWQIVAYMRAGFPGAEPAKK